MKHLLSALVVLIMLCSLLAIPASAAGSGSLSMGSASGAPGDTVTLNVNLSSNPGLVTLTIKVSYDPSVLQLTNVSDPQLLVGAQLNSGYGSPYTISWVDGAATANNTGTGKIAAFTFKILDSAQIGDSTVTLQVMDSYDTDYNENSFYASSGKVTVTCRHSYGSWAKVDSTSHGKTCSACQSVQKEAHKWNNGIITEQPTCKETGQRTFTCTTCGATKTEVIAKTDDHKYGGWTKGNATSHKRTCSVCSQEETANHTWNSGVITKKATCKEEGTKAYTCTLCAATKTEAVAKLTIHTYDHSCDTDCNVCGMTRTGTHNYRASWSKDQNKHWYECAVCKDEKDAAAHTPGPEATETTAQTCTTCGYVIRAALGHKHSYAALWSTDENSHWYSCLGCEEKNSYAAHNFANACDKDCSICGFTRETEHTPVESWTADADNHWHICSGCGLQLSAAAHEPGPEATETTAQTCTICHCEIAPALGLEDPAEPTDDQTVTTPPTSAQQNASGNTGSRMWIVIAAAIVTIGSIVAFAVIKKKAQ